VRAHWCQVFSAAYHNLSVVLSGAFTSTAGRLRMITGLRSRPVADVLRAMLASARLQQTLLCCSICATEQQLLAFY
jgi:hypothetical protein